MIVTDILLYIILFVVMIIDLRTKYIYDLHLIIAVIVIFIGLWDKPMLDHFIGAGLGFAIGYLIYKIAYMVYNMEAFGFGDVLLFAVLGFYFGWVQFLHFFGVVNIMVAVIGIVFLLVTLGQYRNFEIPLAPVYVLGLYCYKLMGSPDLYQFVSLSEMCLLQFRNCLGI